MLGCLETHEIVPVGPDLFLVFMEVKEDAGLAVYSNKLLGDVATVALLRFFVARPSPPARRGADSWGDPVDLERESPQFSEFYSRSTSLS